MIFAPVYFAALVRADSRASDAAELLKVASRAEDDSQDRRRLAESIPLLEEALRYAREALAFHETEAQDATR